MSTTSPVKNIPVTVFTGFLGVGKTTIILSLIQRLPKSYNVVLLKNEFGDVKVDSELASESNVKVTEMLNGCLCCVLVGQMKVALLEIKGILHFIMRNLSWIPSHIRVFLVFFLFYF